MTGQTQSFLNMSSGRAGADMFPGAPPSLGEAIRNCMGGDMSPLDELRNAAGELDGGVNVQGAYTAIMSILREEGMQPLQISSDFMGAGLNIPDPWGTLEFPYASVSDIDKLQMDIGGGSTIEDQKSERKQTRIPIPMLYGGYSVERRVFEASSRNIGGGLDVVSTRSLMKAFMYRIEDVLGGFGSTYSWDGGTLAGFLNYAGTKNTQTRGANWADAATDADKAHVLNDIVKASTTLRKENMPGPFMVYVPLECKALLSRDWKANSSISVRERLVRDADVVDVRIVDRMPDDKYLVTSLSPQNAQYLDGFAPQPLIYMSQDSMTVHVRIFSIFSFAIFESFAGKTGYVEIGA